MISAGYITAGGLAIVASGLLFRVAILLGDSLADEIGRFFDLRGEWAGYGPAAADDDASRLIHGGAVEPETTPAPSRKSAELTGARRHG